MPPSRLRKLLQRRMRYRVMPGGLLFLLILVLTGAGAFLSGYNLLFLIFAAMLALFLVSGVLSRLVLAGLELELQLPEHVSAGAPVPARVLIRNLKRLTPSFSIELSSGMNTPNYIPLLPGGATLETSMELVFPRRGRHRENLFLISTKFPFGFIRKTTTVALHGETLVYPCLDRPQPGIELLLDSLAAQIASRQRGTGREFHNIRPYESQDDARHVDWKSTAHTGSLQIREFAREERPVVEIRFDRRIAPHQTSAFEDLVEQCASLAWSLSLRNIDVLFRSPDFYPENAGVYDILVFLALVEPVDFAPVSTERCEMELPFDDSNLQVIFSAHGDSLTQSAWPDAHIVGPRPNSGDLK